MFLFETQEYIKKRNNLSLRQEISIDKNYFKSISTFYLSIMSIIERRTGNEYENDLIQIFKSAKNKDIKKLICAFVFKKQDEQIGKTDSQSNTVFFDFYKKNTNDIEKMMAELIYSEEEGFKAESGKIYLEILMNDLVSEIDKLIEFKQQNLNLAVLSLSSSFEILVANLLKHDLMYITKNGGWITKIEKPYDELKKLDNVEDIKMAYVTKFIDAQMYKNFDEWLKTSFKILANEETTLIDNTIRTEVSELYQRRNLIVHNNNIVNSTYNEKTKKNLELGKDLEITESYLHRQISNIIKLGSQIIFGSLYKSRKYKNKLMISSLNELGIQILNRNAPELSLEIFSGIFFAGIKREDLPQIKLTGSQSVHLCNIWLSYVLNGQTELFKQELSEYDEKGILDNVKDNIQVQLALKVLNNDPDVMKYVLPFVESIEDKRNKILVLKWPIFNLLSENKDFIDYANKIYYS